MTTWRQILPLNQFRLFKPKWTKISRSSVAFETTDRPTDTMGVCSATSTSLIPFTREQVYDFITNPHNWPKTYKGSAGMQNDLSIPVKLGEEWVETVKLGDTTYYAKWNLKTAIKPSQWIFLQTNGIAATDKNISDGYDGTTEIAYQLEETEVQLDGKTVQGCLFKRTLTMNLPRGTAIPDDLLAVCMKTAGIEGYHDAVTRELTKELKA